MPSQNVIDISVNPPIEIEVDQAPPIEVGVDVAVDSEVAVAGVSAPVERQPLVSVEVGEHGFEGRRGPEGPQGAPGLQGAQGPPGATGGNAYPPILYTFSTAVPVWTIHHSYPYDPTVVTRTLDEDVFYGDIEYYDSNTVIITFAFPMTGTAQLS